MNEKYWVVVEDVNRFGFLKGIAAIYCGGDSFNNAENSCAGNYGLSGIHIIGPYTKEHAIKYANRVYG